MPSTQLGQNVILGRQQKMERNSWGVFLAPHDREQDMRMGVTYKYLEKSSGDQVRNCVGKKELESQDRFSFASRDAHQTRAARRKIQNCCPPSRNTEASPPCGRDPESTAFLLDPRVQKRTSRLAWRALHRLANGLALPAILPYLMRL